MQVFHVPPAGIAHGEAVITGDELHHCRKVLRAVEGDEVSIADGCGVMHRCRIVRITAAEARCRVLQSMPGFNEADRSLHLVQAILKNPAKLDWIVEKAVELGVTSITPLHSRRAIGQKARRDRLESLALGAMKQCCRCLLPDITGTMDVPEALRRASSMRVILLHEDAAVAHPLWDIIDALDAVEPVSVMIGPEGGFADEEVALAVEAGAEIGWLGPRRLRSETAALVALAHFQRGR